jgi:general L-amino acid transport system substrate-binding protein
MNRVLSLPAASLAAVFMMSVAIAPASGQQRPGSTLAEVKKRGHLVCGVNGELAGFSVVDAKQQWSGLDVDLCRAVAAAVLGDATKVKFVQLTAVNRFEMLKSGAVDVLARHTTITLQRAVGSGARFAAITFIDGQAFAVPKRLNITRAAQLDKAGICITRGTTYEQQTRAWFSQRGLAVSPLMFDTTDAMIAAFVDGKCNAVTQNSSGLAAAIVATGKASDYLVLPEVISKEPSGPWVRSGDDAWLDIVRWTSNAMLEAEELKVTQHNVEVQRKSAEPAIRLLLGVEPGNGRALGLDDNWAYRVILQIGNFAESYDRNFGAGSPLKFARGINALWNQGGALYPLPMR